MNTLNKVAIALMFSCLPGLSTAQPILSGSILNNGQFVSPTDSVTFKVRIENTGDAAFAQAWSVGTGANSAPSGNYNTFNFPAAGYPAFDTSPLIGGGVFDFDFFTFIPNAGGAALGPYVGTNAFTMQFADNTIVNFGTAAWTVEGHSVPEPATLALLGLGLAGLGFSRRKQS
jgi:hypothetical protein